MAPNFSLHLVNLWHDQLIRVIYTLVGSCCFNAFCFQYILYPPSRTIILVFRPKFHGNHTSPSRNTVSEFAGPCDQDK